MYKITQKKSIKGEEIGNFITHTVGTVLSVVGLIALILRAVSLKSTMRIVSFSIFGITLILLYLASSLYHGLAIVSKSQKVYKVFKIFDHSSIFLLIAGTYTPFSLVTLKGPIGFRVFIAVWSVAIIGIVLKSIFIGKFPVLFTAMYILMGWFIISVIKPLIASLPRTGILFLFLGGFFYTFGVVFYAAQKLKYNHFIWHFFVILGSIFHYFAILLFV